MNDDERLRLMRVIDIYLREATDKKLKGKERLDVEEVEKALTYFVAELAPEYDIINLVIDGNKLSYDLIPKEVIDEP